MFSQYKTLTKLVGCAALPYLMLLGLMFGVWNYLGMSPEQKILMHYIVVLCGGGLLSAWFFYPFYVIWVGTDKQYMELGTNTWTARPITRAHQVAATINMANAMMRLLLLLPLILLSYLVVPIALFVLPAGAKAFPKGLDWLFGYHGGLPGNTYQERLLALFTYPCNRLATALGTSLGSLNSYHYWGPKDKPGTIQQPSGGFVILDGKICEIVRVIYFGNLFGKYPLNLTLRYGHQASKFIGPFQTQTVADELPVVPLSTAPVTAGLTA